MPWYSCLHQGTAVFEWWTPTHNIQSNTNTWHSSINLTYGRICVLHPSLTYKHWFTYPVNAWTVVHKKECAFGENNHIVSQNRLNRILNENHNWLLTNKLTNSMEQRNTCRDNRSSDNQIYHILRSLKVQEARNKFVPWVVHSSSDPRRGTTPLSTLMPGMIPFCFSSSTNSVPLSAFWYRVSWNRITPEMCSATTLSEVKSSWNTTKAYQLTQNFWVN